MVKPVPRSGTQDRQHRGQIADALNALIAQVQGTDEPAIAAMQTALTASLLADVALNNTANYFDGPSVAQGSTGTWLAIGGATISGSSGDTIDAKLWDGTTVIDSRSASVGANGIGSISLAGLIASPAGNLRISCRNASNTAGSMKFNASGNSKDSTLTALRIK